MIIPTNEINTGLVPRRWNGAARCFLSLLACCLLTAVAWGQEPERALKSPDRSSPRAALKPLDRSSPRAALKTFLESGDAIGAFLLREYFPSPSRAKYDHLRSVVKTMIQGLDLSEVSPAAREKAGRAAAAALYDTLSRIELPPDDAIPDSGANFKRWVIPNTEIALERVPQGPRQGEFLFSSETVANADDFYERVRALPYTRSVPLENLKETIIGGGGWLIPYRWIQAIPKELRVPLAGQPSWKWIGLMLLLCVFALSLRVAYRLSHRGSEQHPFLRSLAQAALPAFLLLATPAFAYLALVQINLIGNAGSAIEVTATVVMFLAGAWICWRLAPVFAEAIIASPQIHTESIDAHLIRICARLLGIVAAVGLLAAGAERIGVPLYGVVAGLGVGGLAIALAAQPTVENLIGGLSLFADKPIRVGDFFRYGADIGTVEGIGIRSTRIRGLDRTLTTIPNAALSKMPVVNFALRDRLLIKTTIGVRYETSPEQLRFLLVKVRELLLGHPRIHPQPARARFVEFGASSLNLEVFAYATTSDWEEFLGIREDVFLRIMDIVKQSGTRIAIPSQTVYFGRDNGLDACRTSAAETQVRSWRDEGRLPFPDFAPEQKDQLRGSLAYPPKGSPGECLNSMKQPSRKD
jgi:MscS family membrane protein